MSKIRWKRLEDEGQSDETGRGPEWDVGEEERPKKRRKWAVVIRAKLFLGDFVTVYPMRPNSRIYFRHAALVRLSPNSSIQRFIEAYTSDMARWLILLPSVSSLSLSLSLSLSFSLSLFSLRKVNMWWIGLLLRIVTRLLKYSWAKWNVTRIVCVLWQVYVYCVGVCGNLFIVNGISPYKRNTCRPITDIDTDIIDLAWSFIGIDIEIYLSMFLQSYMKPIMIIYHNECLGSVLFNDLFVHLTPLYWIHNPKHFKHIWHILNNISQKLVIL